MFHLKYRPNEWGTFYGNDAVVRSLQDKLNSGEALPPAYLFAGVPGTGKTTLAYILARKVGATDKSIIEINAGSDGGIDAIRETIKSVNYFHVLESVKVYIIDESQRLTIGAKDALLRTLEEGCPDHVYFIFCTSEPDKLNKALKRRCVSYDLKPLTFAESEALLSYICSQEQIELSEAVRSAILKQSAGIPGGIAMNLYNCQGQTDEDAISLLSRGVASAEVVDICRMILQPKFLKWPDVMAKVDKLVKQESAEGIRRMMFDYFAKVLKNAKSVKDVSFYTAILEVLDFRIEDDSQGQNGLVYLLGRIVIGIASMSGER